MTTTKSAPRGKTKAKAESETASGQRPNVKAGAIERPVGPKVDPLPPGRGPDSRILFGRSVSLEPLDAMRHGPPLFEASHGGDDPLGTMWTYLPYGPWLDFAAFLKWLVGQESSVDPKFYAIVPRDSHKAEGIAAYLNIRPEAGVFEVGHIWLSPRLQKTRAATDAIFIMMRHAFEELGCRRFEWKCDSLNAPSRAAARRYGFRSEGVFRKHLIVKGRNRDTAWFSITDDEWSDIRDGFQAWLADSNFDAAGKQMQSLGAFVRPAD